jgi:GntR family transcriptional repressor for pyruvate dehydrogenase complex
MQMPPCNGFIQPAQAGKFFINSLENPMRQFKPIKQKRVSKEVAEQLKDSILQGQFNTGERLPSERELSQQFQVSRVTVREALRSLEDSGFITKRKGATGGAFVTDLTNKNLFISFFDLFLSEKISICELNEVRLLVEPEIARLASIKITKEYTEKLNKALETEELPQTPAYKEGEVNEMIHGIMAEMCGNRLFEAISRSLIKLTLQVIRDVVPDNQLIFPVKMHRPVVEAILSGDPEKAALTMKKHIIEFGETLVEAEKVFRGKKSKLA